MNEPKAALKISRVGIALAAYQPDPDVFREQLQSIQNQTFRDWVCVITCDFDPTRLQKDPRIASFLLDSRFIWITNPTRLGHLKNFERGIQLALEQGVQAIGCSDQDDIWYPEKLEVSVRALEGAGPLSLVHCDMHILRNGKIEPGTCWEIEHRGVQNVRLEHFLIRNVVAGCAMLFDAELARRYPVIPLEAEFHDRWYAIAASVHGGVHAIGRPLYAYRQHLQNEVGLTPFVSIFKLPPGISPLEILKKCRRGWERSRRLAQAVEKAGIPLSSRLRQTFVSGWDGGWGILRLGISQYFSDPPLARACIARGFGKALSLILPGLRD